MLFKKIKIQNFRNIKTLEIDNIKQVNLLTGKNNCGKTSILEAIFLLVGMSNPNLALNIHKFRNIGLTNNEEFSFLFKDFDFSRNPIISGKLESKIESQERTLEIKPEYRPSSINQKQFTEKINVNNSDSNSNIYDDSSVSSSYENNPKIEKIEFNYNINEQENYQSFIRLDQGGEVIIPTSYKENIRASFLSPNNIMHTLSEKLENVVIDKDLDSIIKSLQQIEPKIKDIRLARQLVYVDIGFNHLVPINIMGDGIVRILGILASISEQKDGILIIDEIENGFHYSTLSILWRAILLMAFQNNVQLFIATHSYECIEAFIEVYENMREELGEEFVSLFRIENNLEDQQKSFQYEADTLVAGIEQEFEVR